MRIFPIIGAIVLFSTFIGTGFSWDSSWHYRQPLIMQNPAVAITDLQVPVNLSYNSAMQSDFSDILFTTADGAEIPFWIQEKIDSDWAYIWLRVPELLASDNSTFYLYYHGPNFSRSSISSTFIHGDDFTSDTSLNYLYNGTVDWSGDGYLKINGPSYIHPLNQQPTTNIVVEARSNYSEKEVELAYSSVYALSDNITIHGYPYNSFPDYPYTQKARYGGNGTLKQLCYDDGSTNSVCNESMSFVSSEFQRISLYATTYSSMWAQLNNDKIYRGGHPDGNGQFGYITNTDAWLDWFIVRKYAPVQLTYSFGPEEEYSNLSVSINYPDNNVINETTNLMWFSYTPLFTNYNITNCSFHVYIPGFTQFSLANSSEILNNSENLFNLTSLPYMTFNWSIECIDDFYANHGISYLTENRTLTIASPAPAPAPAPVISGGGGGFIVSAPAAPVQEVIEPIANESNETAPEVAEIEQVPEQEEEIAVEPVEEPQTAVTGLAIFTTGNIIAGLAALLVIALTALFIRSRR